MEKGRYRQQKGNSLRSFDLHGVKEHADLERLDADSVLLLAYMGDIQPEIRVVESTLIWTF